MTFDTEKFISEIKKHKAIWDTTSEEYNYRDLKKRSWEELTNAMSDQGLKSEDEAKEFGKSLQYKWKNIRTSYTREIHRREGAISGSAACRKSPYVYFDQLQFLDNTVAKNTSEENKDEAKNDRIPTRSSIFKKMKTADNDKLVDVPRKSISKRAERERNEESDSDRLFILSLLEDFKSIPKHRKLSTKIDLINVIKKAQTNVEPSNSEHGQGYQRFAEIGPETSSNEQFLCDNKIEPELMVKLEPEWIVKLEPEENDIES